MLLQHLTAGHKALHLHQIAIKAHTVHVIVWLCVGLVQISSVYY